MTMNRTAHVAHLEATGQHTTAKFLRAAEAEITAAKKTLRDEVAMHVLAGMVTRSHGTSTTVRAAFVTADEYMKQREQP